MSLLAISASLFNNLAFGFAFGTLRVGFGGKCKSFYLNGCLVYGTG